MSVQYPDIDPSTGYDTSLNGSANRYGGIVQPDDGGGGAYSPGWSSMSTSESQMLSRANWTPVTRHLNGPTFVAMSEAETKWNVLQAQAAMWSTPARQAIAHRFTELVSRYGSTNTPGTLLGIAQSGLDDSTDAIQQVLTMDAQARQQEYAALAPKTAGSPVAQQEDSSLLDNFWKPFEFASRNALGALMMPLEATQAYARNIGGIVTGEGDIGQKAAMLGINSLSMLPPLAPILDGTVVPDDQFQNPWEQTYFGQTLLSAASGNPWDAFNGQQAGLDVGRAMEELLQTQQYAHLMGTPEQEAALIPMATELAKQKGYYSEPGWFIDESSPIGEAQRQSTFAAWAIPGPEDQMTAWTLGRGIASNVGGPDWAGYGMLSGFIDAAASILGDPTIWGAKFGVVSKTMRGAGVLAEKGYAVPGVKIAGAERYMTRGKEARAARQAMGVRNRTIAKAVEEYNAELLMRDPTATPLTAEQFAFMDLADQAETVRDMRLMQARTEAMANSQPDISGIANAARSANRNLSLLRKAEGIDTSIPEPTWTRQADGTYKSSQGRTLTKVKDGWDDGDTVWRTLADGKAAPTPGTAAYARGRELLDEYATTVERGTTPDGQKVRDLDSFYEWYGRLDPADRNILRTMWDTQDRMAASGRIAGTEAEMDAQFLTYLDKPEPIKRGTIEPEQATRDAVRSVTDNKDFIDAKKVLATQDTFGTTLLDAPVPGKPVVGVTISPSGSPADTISYWVGSAEPVLAGVDDMIDPQVLAGIRDQFDAALADGRYSTPTPGLYPHDADTLVSEVAGASTQAADLRAVIADAVNYPGTTYGRVLAGARAAGLDAVLDDILRGLGVDGIQGTSRITGRGVWMGDHPSIETFAYPQDLVERVASISGIPDEAARTQALADMADPAIRADLYGATSHQMEGVQAGAARAVERSRTTIGRLQQAAVVKARIEKHLLDDKEAAITARFTDTGRFAREVLHYESGLTESTLRGVHIDPERARWFLFGNGSSSFLANRALHAMSSFLTKADVEKYGPMARDSDEFMAFSHEWLGNLAMVTRNQWDPSTYRAVLDNALAEGGSDGLLRILSTRIGIDVGEGSIARSLTVSAKDGAREFRTWRSTLGPVGRAARRAAGEYPGSRLVALDVTEEVIDNVVRYARYAKLPDEKIAPLIGKAIAFDGTPGMTAANRQVLNDLFDSISDTLVANLESSGTIMFRGRAGRARKDELISGIKDATRLYIGGETGETTSRFASWAMTSERSAPIDAGGSLIPVPNFHIDSELAHGVVNLPSAEDFAAGVNRISRTIARFSPVEGVYKFTRRMYDNIFRTALLVGRISYVIRNSAEMQVRMFLNGHHSILSDPATMIGMSLGNTMSRHLNRDIPWQARLMDTFAPYRETVLGTAWEVGRDEALAAANHVTGYFSLIRQAHALTDPRVYNTGARTGWKSIGPDAPKFNEGWANELIMLHNSDVARLVVAGPPTAPGSALGALDIRDATVTFFLSSDPNMVRLRSLMTAGDPKFRDIFASQQATRDYLFEHPFSVYNRVTDMTLGGDPLLLDFIKSGRFPHKDEYVSVMAEADLRKRIRDFSSLLKQQYRGSEGADEVLTTWFRDRQVKVPYTDQIDSKRGTGFVDAFFRVANKIERIGTVGPEYRLAYWDKIAELAPTLRAQDVDRALAAARTTLGPIKRAIGQSQFDDIGMAHPAWAALQRAKEGGSDGLLTLDDLHGVAEGHAADVVKDLFYDAARRNDFWSATRLIFPFGQAWGNTIKMWAELGVRNPVQVYKVQKAFNAMVQEGSSALYDFGSEIGAYNDYAPGMAPWDATTNSGFMYSDQYGDTSFVSPYTGYALALPAQWLAAANGINVDLPSTIDVQSPAQSMNLALGGDSILPGIGFVGNAALSVANTVMPDSELLPQLQALAAPYGDRSITSNGIASWLMKVLGGAGGLPVVGPTLEGLVGALTPEQKGKFTKEAMVMLATTGNYDMKDPISLQKMNDDAAVLARTLLLTTGLLQNWWFATPVPKMSFEPSADAVDGAKEMTGLQYGIGMFNVMFAAYRAEAGNDEMQARMDLVRDYGPAALFAVAGEWKGLNGLPSSDALKWARRHPDVADAEDQYIHLFFRKGDGSDVQARRWLARNSEEQAARRSPEEFSQEFVSWMMRMQKSHIDSLEANSVIPPEEADRMRQQVEDRYTGTFTGTTTTLFGPTDEVEHLAWMLDRYPELNALPSTQAFRIALKYRDQALAAAREATGDDNATLGGKKVAPIKERYLADVQAIIDRVPEFYLLGGRLLKEWK